MSNDEEVGVALLLDSAPLCMWGGRRTDCKDGRICSSAMCVCVCARKRRKNNTVYTIITYIVEFLIFENDLSVNPLPD